MRGFYQGAAAGLLSILVSNVTDSSLTPKPEHAFLWFAIGMMYGQRTRRPGDLNVFRKYVPPEICAGPG